MKRNKSLIGFLMVCLVFMSSFLISFDSNAAGNEYYVSYSQPTANELCGYLNVSASNGGGTLYTYFWNIVPDWNEANNSGRECYMYILVNGNSVVFHPYCYGSTAYMSFGYYDSSGALTILYNGSIGLNTYENTQNFTGIWGLSSGGNAMFGTTGSWSTVLVRWNQSVDAGVLNSKLDEVLTELAKIDGDTTSIISQLENIYNQNIATNQKLDNINALLNEIKSEQQETNSWLQKIWTSIQRFFDSDSADKNKVDNFANNSNAQSQNINELNQQSQSEKVDINSASGSVDSYIDTNAISSYSGVLASFTGNPHILQFILIVLAVGLVSYVLFGKR